MTEQLRFVDGTFPVHATIIMEIGVSAEVHFAQKLAANEKKTRDRAIKRLNKYLSVRSRHGSGLSESDLLKIWKGLFYCMWMQDKPLIQEELSQRITSLVDCFPTTEDCLRFVKVFLETMSREWNGIDRLRLDKFMMMMRDMLHQTFLLLSKDDWQESHCRTLALSVYQHVMSAQDSRLPDGLKLHLADIFVDELKKVSTEKLANRTMLMLLQPFVEFVLLTNKLELAHRAISQIIYKVLKASSVKIKVTGGQDTDTDITDETGQVDEDMECEVSEQQNTGRPSFPLDKGLFLKLLFDLAGRSMIRASNRAMIYKLVKKYSGLLGNSASSAGSAEQASSNESEGKNGEQTFFCDVRFLRHDGKALDQQQGEQQIKKHKKKRKNKENDDCDNTAGDIVSDSAIKTITPESYEKVKNRKLGNKNDISALQQNDGSENQNQSPESKTETSKTVSDWNNSADGCARATCMVSRKRKASPDDSVESPTRRKKLKMNNICETSSVQTPTRKSPKKASSVTETSLNKTADEVMLDVDIEMDTNSNARPKYRSSSPPKSLPTVSAVELVKYETALASFLTKKETAKLQAKSPSPKARKHPASPQPSNDRNISEDASLPSDKPSFLNSPDSSLEFTRVSTLIEKMRSKSESPKTVRRNHKKSARATPVRQEDVNPAMSVPLETGMKTPHSVKIEEINSSEITPSSKKKVIFDLRRNKANKFQDYLKSIAKQPEPPYEPSKSPAAGILKSPLVSPALSTSSSETSQRLTKKGAAYKRRISAPSHLVNTPDKKKGSLYKGKDKGKKKYK